MELEFINNTNKSERVHVNAIQIDQRDDNNNNRQFIFFNYFSFKKEQFNIDSQFCRGKFCLLELDSGNKRR